MDFPASLNDPTDVAGFGEPPKPDFWIVKGHPNNPPTHVAFAVPSRTLVDAFYHAALAAGAKEHFERGRSALQFFTEDKKWT